MTDLEMKFQEVKKARKRFGGVVLFDMICNDNFSVQRNERCKSFEVKHTNVLAVVGSKMYCVDRYNKNTGFVYDNDKHELVKVTTYEKIRDEVAEILESDNYEKVLAKVERLRAELAKAEAKLQSFNRD